MWFRIDREFPESVCVCVCVCVHLVPREVVQGVRVRAECMERGEREELQLIITPRLSQPPCGRNRGHTHTRER